MPVAYGSSTTTGDDSQTTGKSVNVPAGAAAGDVMVAFLHRWDSTPPADTVTGPAGWTQVSFSFASGNGNSVGQIWWKRLTGSDAGTYDWTWSGSFWSAIHVIRVTGAISSGDPTVSPDAWAGTAGTYGTTSITTSSPSILLWHAYNDTSAAGNHTPPTGFTEVIDNDCTTSAYLEQSVAGTDSAANASVSTSSPSLAVLIGVLPEASAAAPAIEAPVLIGPGLWTNPSATRPQPWQGTGDDVVTADTNAAAGEAQFSVAAETPAASISVTAGDAALTVDGQDATTTVATTGDVAALTVGAQNPSTTVVTNAGEAALTVAAQDATSSVAVRPAEAQLTVSADNATASVTVNAGVATFTVSADDTTSTVATQVGNALFSVDAGDPSVLSGTVVNAGVAAFSVAAENAAPSVASSATAAEFTVDALAASVSMSTSVSAGVAAFSISAEDATAPLSKLVFAEAAEFGVSALDVTGSVALTGDAALFSVAAEAPDVTVPVTLGTMSNPSAVTVTTMSGDQAGSATMSGGAQVVVGGMGPG